ncbi:MAG: hypothetical protein KGN77_02060 [Xanthomonadaceae bacterium]|nr:hypothetical protein [Xanthomonadaceae bacterium]
MAHRGDQAEWSEAQVERLRGLWDEGCSTAEIGRRMALSKNSIVGKARRLHLPSRRSPIRPRGVAEAAKPKPKRATGPTLPPLLSDAPIQIKPPARPDPALEAEAVMVAHLPAAVVKVRQGAPEGRRCCWPIGEVGTTAFHFCGAALEGRGSYCGIHHARAFVKVPRMGVIGVGP